MQLSLLLSVSEETRSELGSEDASQASLAHQASSWLTVSSLRLSYLNSFLSLTRCSTVSTLNVRSSRAARKKRAVRNRGQGTPAPPVSSSTIMHYGHPVLAHCPRVQAPTHAHPTNSTNKGGRGCGVTWVGLDGAGVGPPRQGPVCSTFPCPWEEQTCLQKPPQAVLFPPGTEGHLCSPHSSGSLWGEEVILSLHAQYQSLPLTIQIPLQTESINRAPGLDPARKGPRPLQPGTSPLQCPLPCT